MLNLSQNFLHFCLKSCQWLLLTRASDLRKTQEDHEDEPTGDSDHLKKTWNRLLSLLLQNFKEDDIQQAPRRNALDHDEAGAVDILLLAGIRDGHPDTDTNGGHDTEDGHVQHCD